MRTTSGNYYLGLLRMCLTTCKLMPLRPTLQTSVNSAFLTMASFKKIYVYLMMKKNFAKEISMVWRCTMKTKI